MVRRPMRKGNYSQQQPAGDEPSLRDADSRLMRRLSLVGLALLVFFAAQPANAEITVADLQIAARALSFMERPLGGTVRVGIIYIPGDAASEREADAVVQLLGGGLNAGNLLVTPVRVAPDAAGTAPVDLFFLPGGLRDRTGPVSAAAAKRKLVCLTVDIAQVEKGSCAVGVQSTPKVRIYVNRAAAIASKSSFVTVFLMMVSEL